MPNSLSNYIWVKFIIVPLPGNYCTASSLPVLARPFLDFWITNIAFIRTATMYWLMLLHMIRLREAEQAYQVE
jgi:hypothetical protein